MLTEFIPSIKLAQTPTPIQHLEKWSKKLGGPQIWIKRDDLTGIGLTGNKVRKLEVVVADALKMGADTLITCGGAQSNHARTTAIVAAQLGLKCHLVLRDAHHTPLLKANLLLDKIVGATIHAVTRNEYASSIDQIMSNLAEYLREEGAKPYIIPEGASNALGAIGYYRAFMETLSQLQSMRISMDAIVCATGSGGTQAGLILGKMVSGWQGEIISFNVCDDEIFFLKKIGSILTEIDKLFGINCVVDKEAIKIIDGYVGPGYGKVSSRELEMITEFSRAEGIFLDPVYTGKAMVGLVDQIEKGRFDRSQNVLFLHTGGLYELFAFEDEFEEYLNQKRAD